MIINIFYLFILSFSSIGHAIETNSPEFIHHAEAYGQWYGVDPESLKYVYQSEQEENYHFEDRVQDDKNASYEPTSPRELDSLKTKIETANKEDLDLQLRGILPEAKNSLDDFIYTSLGPVQLQIRTAYHLAPFLRSKGSRKLVLDENGKPNLRALIRALSLKTKGENSSHVYWWLSLELLAVELSHFQKVYCDRQDFQLYGLHQPLLELHLMGYEIYHADHSPTIARARWLERKTPFKIDISTVAQPSSLQVALPTPAVMTEHRKAEQKKTPAPLGTSLPPMKASVFPDVQLPPSAFNLRLLSVFLKHQISLKSAARSPVGQKPPEK